MDDLEPDTLERTTHAFIIRIWMEEEADGDQPAVWRGHITHAYTGERRFFQELGSVLDFITAYLKT